MGYFVPNVDINSVIGIEKFWTPLMRIRDYVKLISSFMVNPKTIITSINLVPVLMNAIALGSKRFNQKSLTNIYESFCKAYML